MGAEAVARRVLSRGTPLAYLARPAVVNGAAGLVVAAGERLVAVLGFTVVEVESPRSTSSSIPRSCRVWLSAGRARGR